MQPESQIIDDLSRDMPESSIGTRWMLFTDRVMGGISAGIIIRETIAGRVAIRMRGEVQLENNGGFIQIALDLAPEGVGIDVSAWHGIEIDVFGNGEEYGVHLRTDDLTRPWQSYRHTFKTKAQWQTLRLQLKRFTPYRTDIPLNTRRVRRVGFVAIGRAFSADLSVGGLRFTC
jgi:hypothetical protein